MSRLSRFTAFTFLTCCSFLLPAGPAAAIEVCGDGICNAKAVPPENAANCPVDCAGGTDCEFDTCTNGSCSEPTSWVDSDYDGVPNPLEYELAHKFFPTTLLQWHDEDRSESYLFRNRAIPYTLQPYYDDKECVGDLACVEIRYGMAFFYDHGDMWLLDLYEHQGDSETYAALLRRRREYADTPHDPKGWELIRDFTSAHWGEDSSDSSKVGAYECPVPCSIYSGDTQACNSRSTCYSTGHCSGWGNCGGFTSESMCLQFACTWTSSCQDRSFWECYSDVPLEIEAKLFCAESKHALYHTDDECDSGGWAWSDDCPNNEYNMRDWKEGLLQNVGNYYHHAGHDTKIQHPSGCGLYDVWGGAKFGEASPYLQHFTAPINWALD